VLKETLVLRVLSEHRVMLVLRVPLVLKVIRDAKVL
jgi:hypothetical protein